MASVTGMENSRSDAGVPAEGFDQTNDQVQGLEGESDGTAESEMLSAGERGDDSGTGNPPLLTREDEDTR